MAMLAMAFGVTTVGDKLDTIAKVMMETLSNRHKQADFEIGDGFNVAYAAYQRLLQLGFEPVKPKLAVRLARKLMGI